MPCSCVRHGAADIWSKYGVGKDSATSRSQINLPVSCATIVEIRFNRKQRRRSWSRGHVHFQVTERPSSAWTRGVQLVEDILYVHINGRGYRPRSGRCLHI